MNPRRTGIGAMHFPRFSEVSRMATRAVEYLSVEQVDIDAEARLDGRRIGHIWCVRDGDRLKISDLEVVDEHRGLGIGGRLLRLVLQTADQTSVREVWGLVTEKDL